jgi:hypothetical protein
MEFKGKVMYLKSIKGQLKGKIKGGKTSLGQMTGA